MKGRVNHMPKLQALRAHCNLVLVYLWYAFRIAPSTVYNAIPLKWDVCFVSVQLLSLVQHRSTGSGRWCQLSGEVTGDHQCLGSHQKNPKLKG